MRLVKVMFLSVSILLAACAAKRTTDGPPPDYVEIDNPGQTMNPNAPAKIWVPRSYVESGVPRGGDLIKQGTEKVMQTFRHTSPQGQSTVPVQQPSVATQQPVISAAPPVAAAPMGQQTVAAVPVRQHTAAPVLQQPYADRAPVLPAVPSNIKTRIAILDPGQNGLAKPLYDNLRRTGMGGVLDPVQTAYLAQYTTIGSDAEKGAFATRLQQDYGANILIYVSAPDGVVSGKTIVAEVYDAMGGGLLRKFDTVLSMSDAADQAEKDAAVSSALTPFTEKIKDLVAFLPWYGRITAVEGSRAYIAAGKEAGVSVGQILKVYHNGKFIKSLGYAPGELIGTLVVQGFVGTNGAFGQIREGQGIQPTDIVSSD